MSRSATSGRRESRPMRWGPLVMACVGRCGRSIVLDGDQHESLGLDLAVSHGEVGDGRGGRIQAGQFGPLWRCDRCGAWTEAHPDE